MTGSVTLTASGPAPAGGSALDELLYPVGLEEFRAHYWHRRPIHLSGWSGRFAGLFDREALARVIRRQRELRISVRVSGDHEGDDGGAAAHVLIDGDDVVDRLRSGTSVCVDPVDRADARVAALAQELRAGLGHLGPVSVKAYLSTPGFGFNTHFDAQVVTTVQIEGCKRWRVSPEPGVAFPAANAFLDGTGTVRYNGRTPASLAPWERPGVNRDSFVEVLLQPGDVLCLPAGTWHEAKASGGDSLALNFSFAPLDIPELSGPQPLAELASRATELATALRQLAADSDVTTQRLAEALTRAPGRSIGTQPAAAGHADAVAASAVHAGQRLQCVLAVRDAQEAARWWGRMEVSTTVPGVTLGLTELTTGAANRGAVLDFEVGDLEDLRARLNSHGVTVTDPPTEIAGVARVLSAHDPDGNRLMFFEPADEGATP